MTLAEEAVARCRLLAAITDVAGETTRTFLSEGMRRANAQVATWMQKAGLSVHTDAAGNLHGALAGTSSETAPFLLASHLDTVPNAGAFDGMLGVVLAIALAEQCGGSLPFPLRVVAFSEEEGVRFGVPFLGSRALVGELDDALLARTDRDGVPVREAIHDYGLNEDALPAAKLERALGYLEFHIEQGPTLEHENLPLGVVDGIAGQSHFALTFHGTANHAGTTPMNLRRDAMTAAAAWIGEVERTAQQAEGVVATVGSMAALPGVRNVIAGEVRCSLDVRSASDAAREAAAEKALALARGIGEARGIAVTIETLLRQPTMPMDAALTSLLAEAVAAERFPVHHMTSGAGHDAMVVAPHLPTAMLFLRTPGGLSHHPDEAVHTADVASALQVGARFLHRLATDRERLAAQQETP